MKKYAWAKEDITCMPWTDNGGIIFNALAASFLTVSFSHLRVTTFFSFKIISAHMRRANQ